MLVLRYEVTATRRSDGRTFRQYDLNEDQANTSLAFLKAASRQFTRIRFRAYVDGVQEIKKGEVSPTLANYSASCDKSNNNYSKSCPSGEESPKGKEKAQSRRVQSAERSAQSECYAFPCMSPICHKLKYCKDE